MGGVFGKADAGRWPSGVGFRRSSCKVISTVWGRGQGPRMVYGWDDGNDSDGGRNALCCRGDRGHLLYDRGTALIGLPPGLRYGSPPLWAGTHPLRDPSG